MLLNIKRTRELLAEKSIDVLVATSPMHVFYSSDVPTVMSMPNRIMFSVMSRNPWIASIIQKEAKEAIVCANAAAETVKATTWIENVKTYAALSTIERPKNARIDPIASSLMEGIAKVIGEFGAKDGRVAVEKSKLPLSAYVELQKLLPKATFGDADEIFVKLRSIKSAEEVSKIKRATEITQKAIQSAMDATREGVSELELLEVLKSTIFNEGGDWLHTTVSAGKYNSAAIYHAPTNYRLKKGDVLRLDLGAVYNGYASDLARVAVVGNPSSKVARIYQSLVNAQQEVVSRVRAGVLPSELFSICIEKVRKAGYPTYNRGMVGHGIGLEVEEFPMISPSNNAPLEVGMVLAIEVPRYIVGIGGFNIEDILMVKKDGNEILSSMDRGICVR